MGGQGYGRRPIGGHDYPRTYQEFQSWFPDELACREYLAGLRWPHGFSCPGCGSGGCWRTGTGLDCADWWEQTSATWRSFIVHIHPLSIQFAAIWFVTSQKNGSRPGVCRTPGFGSTRLRGRGCTSCAGPWCDGTQSCSVAWLSSTRASRQAAATAGWAGQPRRRRSRSPSSGLPEAAVWAERGSIWPRCPHGLDQVEFARDVIAPGTEIHTDGAWVLTRSVTTASRIAAPRATWPPTWTRVPGPHLVSSLLKRWTAGTLHHRISRQQRCPLPRRVHLPVQPADLPEREGCCSTGCSNRPPALTRTPSASSSAAPATTGTNPQTTKPQLHSSR